MSPDQFKSERGFHGSQRKVAARLGVGFRTLQRIEAGSMGDPVPVKYENMLRGLSRQEGIARGLAA